MAAAGEPLASVEEVAAVFDNAAMDGYAIRTADVVDAKVDAPTILKAREHS